MAQFEEQIATYLTIGGTVFIAPQYEIDFDGTDGGASPDFVALDLGTKQVVVVEVTTRAHIAKLADRIDAREHRWFRPLRRQLAGHGLIGADWRYRVLGVVRGDVIPRLEARFADSQDVAFVGIEEATFPWQFWDKRLRDGLPGAHRAAAAGQIVRFNDPAQQALQAPEVSPAPQASEA